MADYHIVSMSERFRVEFDRLAAEVRCAMPGIITEFFPETQTATVQPAIKMKLNLDGKPEYRDMPLILNTPVVLPFAQSAGLLLTLPIKPGDECLLVFSDRAFDNFMQLGGSQPTPIQPHDEVCSPRAHSLADAICIPGIISNPQAVPAYNTEHIELRDRERKQYLSLGPTGITITDGEAVWNMKGGKVTLDAPAGIEETSQSPVSRTTTARQTLVGSNFRVGAPGSLATGVDYIENTLQSLNGTFIDSDGVNLGSHIHTGVYPGDGTSSLPVTGDTGDQRAQEEAVAAVMDSYCRVMDQALPPAVAARFAADFETFYSQGYTICLDQGLEPAEAMETLENLLDASNRFVTNGLHYGFEDELPVPFERIAAPLILAGAGAAGAGAGVAGAEAGAGVWLMGLLTSLATLSRFGVVGKKEAQEAASAIPRALDPLDLSASLDFTTMMALYLASIFQKDDEEDKDGESQGTTTDPQPEQGEEPKLSDEEIKAKAKTIARHAWEKHKGEYKPPFASEEELAEYIEHIMRNPSDKASLNNGKTIYWDDERHTIIIDNPWSTGSCFPTTKDYYNLEMERSGGAKWKMK